MSRIEQKTIRFENTHGNPAYYNFMHYGNDLENWSKEGWRIIHVHDDPDEEILVILLEKKSDVMPSYMEDDWREFWKRLLSSTESCLERDAIRDNKKSIQHSWLENIMNRD